MWILRTEGGADEQFSFRILPGSIKTIGRATGAEFKVDAALVSRVHCRLTAGATELEVFDLDSTNGTFVNGTRVTRALLNHGDRLGVGRVELIVSRASVNHMGSQPRDNHTGEGEEGRDPSSGNTQEEGSRGDLFWGVTQEEGSRETLSWESHRRRETISGIRQFPESARRRDAQGRGSGSAR